MKILFFFLSFLISVPAIADWVLYAESADGETTFYIDPSTIKKRGTVHRAWVLSSKSTPEVNGATSSRSLVEVDCDQEMYRFLTNSTFSKSMAQGDVVTSSDVPTVFRYIAPDTVAASMKRAVCPR